MPTRPAEAWDWTAVLTLLASAFGLLFSVIALAILSPYLSHWAEIVVPVLCCASVVIAFVVAQHMYRQGRIDMVRGWGWATVGLAATALFAIVSYVIIQGSVLLNHGFDTYYKVHQVDPPWVTQAVSAWPPIFVAGVAEVACLIFGPFWIRAHRHRGE